MFTVVFESELWLYNIPSILSIFGTTIKIGLPTLKIDRIKVTDKYEMEHDWKNCKFADCPTRESYFTKSLASTFDQKELTIQFFLIFFSGWGHWNNVNYDRSPCLCVKKERIFSLLPWLCSGIFAFVLMSDEISQPVGIITFSSPPNNWCLNFNTQSA